MFDGCESILKFFAIILAVVLIGCIPISIRRDAERTRSINMAVEEEWDWYFNGEEVNHELFDISKYDLAFDYENNSVLMSEKRVVETRPVIMPIVYSGGL